MDSGIRQLTLFEIEILGELSHHQSLRALGRAMKLEAPHLSKILSRIETKLDVNVIKRSPKGIVLSPEGLRLVKLAETIVKDCEGLKKNQSVEQDTPKQLSIASSRFLSAFLLAPHLSKIKSSKLVSHIRLLDMSPNEVNTAALKGACEVTVSVGEPSLTKAWATTKLGEMVWGLFVSRKHPLASSAKEKDVLQYPFLVPTYWTGTAFEVGDDYCPVPWKNRIQGDESSSILTAVEIIRNSADQLVFAPRLVMHSYFGKDIVREIRVREWQNVKKEVYLSVHAETVSKKLEANLMSVLSEGLI